MRPLTFLLLLTLCSCGKNTANQDLSGNTDSPVDSSIERSMKTDTIHPDAKKYLEPGLLKLKGKIPVVCSYKELYEVLGEPDSIVTPDRTAICTSYFEKEFRYAYFGNSYFEISGDSAAACVLYSDKLELIYNNQIVFNNSLSLESVEKSVFCQDKQEVDVPGLGKMVALKVAVSKENHDGWLLFFKDKKLKRIDYWIPC